MAASLYHSNMVFIASDSSALLDLSQTRVDPDIGEAVLLGQGTGPDNFGDAGLFDFFWEHARGGVTKILVKELGGRLSPTSKLLSWNVAVSSSPVAMVEMRNFAA
jgi:hypothetical protein